MSKRLEILKASLIKKEAILDERFQTHFASVKQANGQPLNDKRNGHATFRKWEREEDAIRNQMASIEKTKAAIEREEGKIFNVEDAKKTLPKEILDLVDSGVLNQWRKHPNRFFVVGVDKARIIWDEKKKTLGYIYLKSVTDKDQYKLFAKTYNALNKVLGKK